MYYLRSSFCGLWPPFSIDSGMIDGLISSWMVYGHWFKGFDACWCNVWAFRRSSTVIRHLVGDIQWSLTMIEPRMGRAWRTLTMFQCMGIGSIFYHFWILHGHYLELGWSSIVEYTTTKLSLDSLRGYGWPGVTKACQLQLMQVWGV